MIKVIYEDQDILVINKPAGMVVNNSQTTKNKTIQQWFTNYYQQRKMVSVSDRQQWFSLIPDEFDDSYGQPAEIFQQRGGIVHRLDKNTSGALILAKNPGSLLNLMMQFKLRRTKKSYLALVHGLIQPQTGIINAPIKRHFSQRKKMSVAVGGREAATAYQMKQTYRLNQSKLMKLLLKPNQVQRLLQTTNAFSFIVAQPKTGRMHQIRVHFAHLGHPLVADDKYVGRKRYPLDMLWCPRHFLHASSLRITHPRTGESIIFEAPLAKDLQKSLEFLEEIQV